MAFYRAVIEIGAISLPSGDIDQSSGTTSASGPIVGLYCTVVAHAGREEPPLDAMRDAGLRFWRAHRFSRIAPDSPSFKCEVDSFRQIEPWEYLWLKHFSKALNGCTFYCAAEQVEN
ncbi:hypothetical protein [Maricaulis sp.]|uniref:hypothetical protein n=1 Tax=Maricaulis sp. TaxID=1486257 RepID=UPI003A8E67FA